MASQPVARALGYVRRVVRRTADVVAVAAMVLVTCAGCGGTNSPSAAPEPRFAASSRAGDEVARTMRFRESFGLRTDEAWIRHVAVDPLASRDFGVPLVAEEAAHVDRRLLIARTVSDAVQGYAVRQPEYAGARIDVERGGIVVMSFAGRIDQHRLAIARLVPPDARLEIKAVPNTFAELNALAHLVGSGPDEAWLRSIGAVLVSSGVDTERNLARVRISSANPEAGDAIIARYRAQGRMYVESDGIGVRLMPTGTLVVVAVDPRGAPVPGLAVTCTGDLPATGTGDIGSSTDANGMWRSDLTATGYTCELLGDGSVVGSGRALVEAGEITNVLITSRGD